MAAFGNLANDTRRPASDDGKARDDHGRRHYGAVEDLDVVLDDGELAYRAALADVHMVSDACGLHDGALPDKHMIAHAQRHVGEVALIDASRRS